MVLRGTQKTDVEWMEGKRLKQAMHKLVHFFAIQVQLTQPVWELNSAAIMEPKMQKLLENFADVFEEPKTLPPPREYDHKILLKPGTTPISVMPYRYPALQKDIIEKAVQEML